jgi:hypothetical protein
MKMNIKYFSLIIRTGQRSTMGLLKDGYNSCMRYVLNNFFDGFRQVRKKKFFFSFENFLSFLVY